MPTLQDDNALFEGHIEELVGMNDVISTERDEVNLERDSLLLGIEETRQQAAAQLQQTGEQIVAMLAAKPGGRQLPQVPGSVTLDPMVEVPLNRAKNFIAQMQAEAAEAKGGGSLSNEEQHAMQSQLDQATLDKEEVEGKLSLAADAKESLEVDVAAKEGKIGELETQVTDLIERLFEVEFKLEEKGGDADAITATREIEESAIKKLQEEKAFVVAENKALKAKNSEALEAAGEAAAQLKQARLDLQNAPKGGGSGGGGGGGGGGPVFSDATNIKLQQFKILKRKMQAQLSQKKASGEAPPPAVGGSPSKRGGGMDFKTFYENKLSEKNAELNLMKKENRELRKETTGKEARMNEIKNRLKQKENKVHTLIQQGKSLQVTVAQLKDDTGRRQSVGRAVPGGRRSSTQGQGQPASRGVRGGGISGGGRRDSGGRKWPVEESVKRQARAPAPEQPQDPEQVEYV